MGEGELDVGGGGGGGEGDRGSKTRRRGNSPKVVSYSRVGSKEPLISLNCFVK